MEMSENTELRDILSTKLTAVCFVLDYVEFHFEYSILLAFVPPVFLSSSGKIRFPDQGCRDSFCSLIQEVVQDVKMDSSMIQISFGRKGSLNILLTPDSQYGPEAAHFVPGDDKPITVW
jgi:hypothetical protein